MSKKTMVATDVEVLEEQVRQNREEINRLKQEVEQLCTQLGLSGTEEFESHLNKGEVFEFGTVGNGVVKGKINWMNSYLIGIATSEEEPPAEVLIFKQALAYIRKTEKKSAPRHGMYI